MNICLAINRCFTSTLRCFSKCSKSPFTEQTVFRVLNVICAVFAISETTWITGYLFLVLIPDHYERTESIFSTWIRVLWGALCAFNVVFHYWMTRSAEPFGFPKSAGGHCSKCSAPKPRGTFHCSTCNKCVYKMDHHCPWIAQCLGAHNQANFFCFLFSVFQSTVLVLYAHWQFWWLHLEHWIHEPMVESLSKRGGVGAFITFLLVVLLHLVIVSFLITYVYLVSDGMTYLMKIFKKSNGSSVKRKHRKNKNTQNKKTFEMLRARWLQYLKVPRGGSILNALFIPADRRITDYDYFD